MIGIFTALLGSIGFIGGNLTEQCQNDQARINASRNPQNTTGTYMDYRGKMRDTNTNQPVILSGDGKGNIIVKDIHGVTIRVSKIQQDTSCNKKIEPKEIPYHLRNAKKYTRPMFAPSWQCGDCGAWNYMQLDNNCRGCSKEKAENDYVFVYKAEEK